MDRFDAMQAFARVVETGSFTKAAETLRISRTSVTQLVQQLEARLRVRLLNRTTRQVNVTADGAAYYERVLRLLADMDDAETSLSGASASPGRLRVDVPSPFARMVLVPALPVFHARHPEIQLDLGVSDRKVDLIGENVDCVIRGGELQDQSLRARRVADLRLGVCVAGLSGDGGRATASGRAGRLAPSHRGLSVGAAGAGAALCHAARRRAPERARTLRAGGGRWQRLSAGRPGGLGILWLPDYMARPHLASGELARLFEDWDMETMPMYLAYPPNRHVSAKLRAFIDWVVELMARQA